MNYVAIDLPGLAIVSTTGSAIETSEAETVTAATDTKTNIKRNKSIF